MTNSKPTGQRRRLFDQIRTLLITSISSGANAKAVQRMLGHKSAAMTLDVYADLFEDDLDAVAVAMNEAAVRALAQPGGPSTEAFDMRSPNLRRRDQSSTTWCSAQSRCRAPI